MIAHLRGASLMGGLPQLLYGTASTDSSLDALLHPHLVAAPFAKGVLPRPYFLHSLWPLVRRLGREVAFLRIVAIGRNGRVQSTIGHEVVGPTRLRHGGARS